MTATTAAPKTNTSGTYTRGGSPRAASDSTRLDSGGRQGLPLVALEDRDVLPDTPLLQLMFAQLNNECFGGEIPTHRIAYNARFTNVAGRITYKPPLIELSPKHFASRPEALRDTLLHEMIHAWLYARGENPGHTPAFKRKMRELGMDSIYHDMGSAAPRTESARRFILRCDRCTMEVLRKRRPSANVSCGRCSGRRFDPRYPLRVFEVTETKELEAVLPRAARRRPP
jgi:predicted SprT family Zn-dependent metalloprotease